MQLLSFLVEIYNNAADHRKSAQFPKLKASSNLPCDLSVLQLLHRLVKFRETDHGRFEAKFSCHRCQWLSFLLSNVTIPRRANSMVSSTSAMPATSVPLMDWLRKASVDGLTSMLYFPAGGRPIHMTCAPALFPRKPCAIGYD
jgi:hypothetical protein